MEYRYPHFQRKLLKEDASFTSGPVPGEALPDFELLTTEGDLIRKNDFTGTTPLLLTLGSFT